MLKIRKVMYLFLMLSLVLSCILINKQNVVAKTTELSATLMQKSNPFYKNHVNNRIGVAYKVEIKKKVIIIHGSLNKDYHDTKVVSNIGKHTYKLSKNVKYVSRGGEAPDQEFTKKDFKKYLNECKDSQLGLVLEFKNFKVSKVVITS